jgi:predicted GNAT family acetyltransferase
VKVKTEGVRAVTIKDWTDNAPIYVRDFLEHPNACQGFVKEGKLVSCAPSPDRYLGSEGPDFALIRGVWTDSSYRGNGLATSSMKALCLELFDEVNVEKIFLRVEERNPAAIRIYEKLGFQTAGKWLGSQCYFI